MNPDEDQGECFLSRDGKQYGPYAFYILVEAVRRDVINKTDLIWRRGWDEWRPAAYVDGLYSPPPFDGSPTHTPASAVSVDQSHAGSSNERAPSGTQAGIAVASPLAQRKRNYFIRHWRGELSLPVSYWLNGLLATVFTVALTLLFGELMEGVRNSGLIAILIVIF